MRRSRSTAGGRRSRRSMSDLWSVLNYEIQMYFGVQILQRINIQSSDPALTVITTSALTEVKSLHIRILTEVFLSGGRSDDIKIEQLLPLWRQENAGVLKTLEIAYTEDLETGKCPKWYLDKFLAHATKKRGDSFDWTPIVNKMDPPLRRALATLPVDKLPALAYFRQFFPIS